MGLQTDRLPPAAALAPHVRRAQATARGWAALVLLGCLGVLGVAAWLEPDPRGFGTHERFGTGPCGMLVVTGYPCPTCGMTTSFAHAVRGQWCRAFMVQPAGFVLALGAMGAVLGAVYVLITGRWPLRFGYVITPHRLFLALLVLLLGGWAFKLVTGVATGRLPTH